MIKAGKGFYRSSEKSDINEGYLKAELKIDALYENYLSICKSKSINAQSKNIFSSVIKSYNLQLIDLVLEGEKVNLGKQLTSLKIIEEERTGFIKEDGTFIGIVNWPATTALNQIDPKTGKLVKIYYNDPFQYKIIWGKKNCGIKNSRFYKFEATKYFRRSLKKRIDRDKLVTLKYRKNS